jgi:hypothetical protein
MAWITFPVRLTQITMITKKPKTIDMPSTASAALWANISGIVIFSSKKITNEIVLTI